ncbi:MAG: phage tail tape-measure protein, partial [Alphaproteobacteria bacterium]
MTVASLGLAVDSSSVVAATPALDRMTAASQKAEAAAGQLGRASSGASGGVRQLEKAAEGVAKASMVMNTARGNTANIAAQFQDIAVSAQMGMGALQVGLQQGTQLAAVISAMENPIKGLGSAFLSVISPVSLLVIGLTSLAVVGLQMVDWTAVAKAGLNAVADALVVIAPYAVAAAAGLALLYAPTLISGAASLVLSLGSVAKGI